MSSKQQTANVCSQKKEGGGGQATNEKKRAWRGSAGALVVHPVRTQQTRATSVVAICEERKGETHQSSRGGRGGRIRWENNRHTTDTPCHSCLASLFAMNTHELPPLFASHRPPLYLSVHLSTPNSLCTVYLQYDGRAPTAVVTNVLSPFTRHAM